MKCYKMLKRLSCVFLLAITFFISGGSAQAASCSVPSCPHLTGDPTAAFCRQDVCNPHVFVTCEQGRLLDWERMFVDTAWPCPGTCPEWDETNRTYVRQFMDLGWQLRQISSILDCEKIVGKPAYFSNNTLRTIVARTDSGRLLAWTSSSECCRTCEPNADAAGRVCTLIPAENECDPPVCYCTPQEQESSPCPDGNEPWPNDPAQLTPCCNCEDSDLNNSDCCWSTEDLTAFAGITIQGNPSFCGDEDGAFNTVFARSENNHMVQWWREDGNNWRFTDLTSAITTGDAHAFGDPACFMADGVQYVVFKGDGDHLIGLYHIDEWHFADLTSVIGGMDIDGTPAIHFSPDAQTGYIFARGKNGLLLEWMWNNDGISVDAGLCNYSIAGNPSICYCRGEIHVFFRDTDNHLIEVWKDCRHVSSWRCSDLTINAGCGRTIAGDPFCLYGCESSTVFVRGMDGHLLRLFRKADNWSGWRMTDLSLDIGCTNDIGMSFSFLRAGSFSMGSPLTEYGRDPDEWPVHQVTLTNPFYMGTTEVTQAQWTAIMGVGPSHSTGCETCPVGNVSWHEVMEFVARMNQRCEGEYSIPTEAEWEYAARGGTENTPWFFGFNLFSLDRYAWFNENSGQNTYDRYAWFDENSGQNTHPVAWKWPNPYGLFDIYGNVWEWVADAYAPYTSDPVVNPLILDYNWAHIIRGGSAQEYADKCRSASRHYYFSSDCGHPYLGVRLKRISPGE